MINNFGLPNSVSFSERQPSDSALPSTVSNAVAVVNRTVWPCSTIFRPSPIAHRRLQRELELLERPDTRKVRDLKPHPHPLGLLRIDLALQDSVEEFEI